MVLTDPNVIKDIKRKFGFEFKKAYGQNFLTSEKVLSEICESVRGSEGILEIGPGFGTLTNALAAHFDKVVAIEIDKNLPEVLDYTLKDHSNVKIISGDCMKMDLNRLIAEEFEDKKVSLAANLPYYITTPIITTVLESKLPLENMVVMVQKEVAERLCAVPGGKEYGAISVLCSYYTQAQIVAKVPAGCFVPAPKVDSAVVLMKIRKEPPVELIDEKMFFRVVKAAFSQRRKTLLNCLASGFGGDKVKLSGYLEEVGINPARRGETLSIDEFGAISNKFKQEGM